MAAPRLVIKGGDPTAGPRHLPPAPAFGWYLLGWIGVVFVIVGMLDLILAWIPARFGSAEWEFGTVSRTLDSLPLASIGLALSLAAAVATGRRLSAQVVAGIFLLLALLILGMAVLYATTVPLALSTVTDPLLREGLYKGIVKATGQALLYPIAFIAMAIKGLRHATRARAGARGEIS